MRSDNDQQSGFAPRLVGPAGGWYCYVYGPSPHDFVRALSDRLLILWLALLGASRVDLLAGGGAFVLTPFLVLSPVLIGVELWRLAGDGSSFRLPDRAASFVLAILALLSLLLASTFLSYDLVTSSQRFALLLVQVAFVLLVGLALASRPDPGAILLKGFVAGLGVAVAFSVLQLAVWFLPTLWPVVFQRVVDLEPGSYAGIVPRLTGASHDANLGAIQLVVYLAVILVLSAPSRVRTVLVSVGAGAVVLTLSRSGVLAGLTLWVAMVLMRRRVRLTPVGVGTVGAATAVILTLLLLAPGTLDPLVAPVDAVGQRLTVGERSASEHAALLARGWEVGTESVKHALLGVGYGNAYIMVQDIFPGNEYGNFHSLFVTLFAEAGAIAALSAVAIFGVAFFRGGSYAPLIAALFVFNLFQQAHTEPALWLSLMLAWMGIGVWEQAPDAFGEVEPLQFREERDLRSSGVRS